MTNQSLYPTNRQRALLESADVKIKYHHVITSAAIIHFRLTFKVIMLAYVVIMTLGVFELIGIALSKGGDQSQMLSFGMAFLVVILAGTMGLMHNQVMLVLGHGYKSKEAQLYVDRLTPLGDCQSNLKIIRSMYLFASIIALIFLWVLWGLYGTPLYEGEWLSQTVALKSFIGQVSGLTTDSNYQLAKPFIWVATVTLLLVIGSAVMGWIQAKIAENKINV